MLNDYQRYRMYEILPGLSIWLTLIGALVLSFLRPIWMIYFIIVFDIYWVLKVVHFSFYLILAWLRFAKVKKTDWDKEVQNLPDLKTKHHLIFLTLYKEEWEVVRSAIQSISKAAYDAEQFVLVIAGEEKAKENYESILKNIQTEFKKDFSEIVGTLHPMNLPDEIPGKGSNLHFSEKKMKEFVDEKGWKYEDTIVTIFDIDTICHSNYFRYLTFLYCNHPRPTRTSFQPIALYNNNMWESPAVLRIMAFGTTFWTFTSLAKQDTLVTFSSHSMSFQALVDVGYHDKRIVSEDSRIFFQCFLRYNGQYDVTPMYLPVSMDTVRDDKWGQSIKNLYKQQRRWAWGVEHIPYLLWEFRKKGNAIPWYKKLKLLYTEWEGKWSWCIVAILITILGRLPIWVAPETVRQSALYFNTPYILQVLMTIAMLGLLLSAVFSFPLLPPRPRSHPRHIYLLMLAQWALLPFSLIFVSSIPAIDAVTHMMFGKYLGFNVSQKKRRFTPIH